MTNDITNSVNAIIAKYIDPQTKIPFNKDNSDINTNIKDGHVNVSININPIYKDNYAQLVTEMKSDLKKINKVLSVNVMLTSEKIPDKQNLNNHKWKIKAKKIIAIASGKGGVGKSTFSTNFAVALKQLNNKVGILDADIYGPSIPRMMGISGKPQVNENKKLIPLENYGIKCMSIGFLIDVDTPAIWRGPMVMKALEQMYNGVEWGELDYLIVDLPPGTGDAQLSLAQSSKLSGSIIVSTPQDVALIDARKGINMFKKVNVPVLGIVENMSYFICDSCKNRHEIFSYGGAKKEAEKSNIPFLGELPLDKDLRVQSDLGRPACIDNPSGEMAKIYLTIAQSVINQKN